MTLVVQVFAATKWNRIRRGFSDANGQPALTRLAEGLAKSVPPLSGSSFAEGEEKLVLAYRPFRPISSVRRDGTDLPAQARLRTVRRRHAARLFRLHGTRAHPGIRQRRLDSLRHR